MLAHDKHGYPDDFVSNSEPNARLRPLKIELNPKLREEEFQGMLARAGLLPTHGSEQPLTLDNLQARAFESYWSPDPSFFDGLSALDVRDVRRLLHPDASRAQGLHDCEQ